MGFKKGYDIISPDGFGIFNNTIFSTIELAENGFNKWIERFKQQGYYSTSFRERIPLDELRFRCELIEFEFDSNDFNGDYY